MSAFFDGADGAAVRNRSFAEILDDVATKDETPEPSRMRSFSDSASQDWFFSMLNRAAYGPKASPDAFFDADESAGTIAEDIAEPVPAEPISFDLDEDKIAAELGLASARSVTELKRARRAFARRYHPDLFAPHLQPLANARMQLANMLLDKKRRELEGRY